MEILKAAEKLVNEIQAPKGSFFILPWDMEDVPCLRVFVEPASKSYFNQLPSSFCGFKVNVELKPLTKP